MALHPGEAGYDERYEKPARRSTDRQQAPTGEGEVVLGVVLRICDDLIKIREYAPTPSDIREQAELRKVREALEARAEMGKAKYGTYLRVNNGRNATLDLYQELLDAIMYSAQAKLENNESLGGSYLYLLIDMARRLAPRID